MHDRHESAEILDEIRKLSSQIDDLQKKVDPMYLIFTKSITIREFLRSVLKSFVYVGTVATAWYAVTHIFHISSSK